MAVVTGLGSCDDAEPADFSSSTDLVESSMYAGSRSGSPGAGRSRAALERQGLAEQPAGGEREGDGLGQKFGLRLGLGLAG